MSEIHFSWTLYTVLTIVLLDMLQDKNYHLLISSNSNPPDSGHQRHAQEILSYNTLKL